MHRLRNGLRLRGCWQWKIFIVHVHGDEVGRVWLYRTYVAAMRRGDEDCAARVSSLTDKEPLVIVKAHIDIVREVIREDCSDSCGRMVRKGEAPLCCGRSGSVHERAACAEDRDVSRNWGSSVHQGSEVLVSRGGDKNVIGVNGSVLMKWSEEESVENFLGDLGGSGRHC